MSKSSRLHCTLLFNFSLLFLHIHLQICDGVSFLALQTAEMDAMAKRASNKSIEGCLTEPEVDSESNRRLLLMQKKYISYDTLKRDMVPCQEPGASYYECHVSTANPYSRGCEIITRCARGS